MKKLLKESEIRKMMKFANISALSDGFVEKLHETSYYEEELEEDDSFCGRPGINEVDDDDPLADAEGPPLDDPEVEAEPEVDLEPDDAEVSDVDAGVLEGVQTVIKAIKTGLVEMGLDEVADKIDVELESEEEPAEPGLDVEPELELPPDELGAEEEEEVLPPSPEPTMQEGELDEEDMLNEVVRRVAKRLMRK